MLALVSPAKKLDFEVPLPANLEVTQPGFLDDTEELLEVAENLTRADLKRLMKLSDNLAELNFQRFKAFEFPFTKANAMPAALVFKGDTYVGLGAESMSKDDLAYAQDHFRILSGLYGLLRPLDLIQPYRLEMGTKLNNARGGDLYDFWGDDICDAINEACAETGAKAVVNCASNEYFKAARAKNLKTRLITPVFKEVKHGEARVLSLMAKRARGMMARFIIQNRVTNPDDLKGFNGGGYTFQPAASDGDSWLFTRPQPPKKS